MTKSGSVSIQMDEILRDVNEDTVSSMKKNVQKVAKESAQKLKNTSPRKSGSYAQGWAARRISDTEYIVHNKTHYQLTHLLENGHVIRDKKGTYGRTHPIKHIAPVEEWAVDELPRRILEDI